MPDAPAPENATFLHAGRQLPPLRPARRPRRPARRRLDLPRLRPQPRPRPPLRRREDRLPHPRLRPPRRRRDRRPHARRRSAPAAARAPARRPPRPPLRPPPLARAPRPHPRRHPPRPHPGRRRDARGRRRPRRRRRAPPPPLPRRPQRRLPLALPRRPPRRPRHRRRASQPGAYRLTFAPTIRLESADADGRRHGLTALLHLLHGATTQPADLPLPRHRHDRGRPALRLARLPPRRLAPVLAGRRRPPLPRHPRLVPDERLPLAPDRRRGLALRGPGPAHPHHHRRHPRRRRGPPAAARRPLRHPHPVLHHRAKSTPSSPTPPRLGIEIVPEVDIPGHSTAMLAAAPPPRRPRRAAELRLGPGLRQQRPQPRHRGDLRRPRPRLRRHGRPLPLAPHPHRRRRGGEELAGWPPPSPAR